MNFYQQQQYDAAERQAKARRQQLADQAKQGNKSRRTR